MHIVRDTGIHTYIRADSQAYNQKYIRPYTRTNKYTYIHRHTHTYIHTHPYIQAGIHIQTNIHTYRPPIHTYTHTNILAYRQSYTHTEAYGHMHACTHTHIRTNKGQACRHTAIGIQRHAYKHTYTQPPTQTERDMYSRMGADGETYTNTDTET